MFHCETVNYTTYQSQPVRRKRLAGHGRAYAYFGSARLFWIAPDVHRLVRDLATVSDMTATVSRLRFLANQY